MDCHISVSHPLAALPPDDEVGFGFFLRDDWTSIKSVLVVLVCTRFDLVGLATLSHRLACSLCITKQIKRCKPLLELSVWMICTCTLIHE